MQALHELLVRLAALPALHTNNGSSMIMQGYNAKCKYANKGVNKPTKGIKKAKFKHANKGIKNCKLSTIMSLYLSSSKRYCQLSIVNV
jgi:hypothetical protein